MSFIPEDKAGEISPTDRRLSKVENFLKNYGVSSEKLVKLMPSADFSKLEARWELANTSKELEEVYAKYFSAEKWELEGRNSKFKAQGFVMLTFERLGSFSTPTIEHYCSGNLSQKSVIALLDRYGFQKHYANAKIAIFKKKARGSHDLTIKITPYWEREKIVNRELRESLDWPWPWRLRLGSEEYPEKLALKSVSFEQFVSAINKVLGLD